MKDNSDHIATLITYEAIYFLKQVGRTRVMSNSRKKKKHVQHAVDFSCLNKVINFSNGLKMALGYPTQYRSGLS